ncbi:MAG: hypothetical protein Q7S29_02905 [Candidatus Peribacter sp.]|nr:hypothetical protein [Candidatus Peribacter sp.]
MPETPEPTAAERATLMNLAIAEVHIAQSLLRARGTEEGLKQRFPESYAGILRAVARRLERDHETRHAIYRLLNCESEK